MLLGFIKDSDKLDASVEQYNPARCQHDYRKSKIVTFLTLRLIRFLTL